MKLVSGLYFDLFLPLKKRGVLDGLFQVSDSFQMLDFVLFFRLFFEFLSGFYWQIRMNLKFFSNFLSIPKVLFIDIYSPISIAEAK